MGVYPKNKLSKLLPKYAAWLFSISVVLAVFVEIPELNAQAAQRTSTESNDSSSFSEAYWWLPHDKMLGFVEVPSGSFPMGSNPLVDPMAFENERWSVARRQGTVDLPSFYIARYETTVAQFKVFVESASYNADPQSLQGELNDPVNFVTWTDAVAYARWLDRQLRLNANIPGELKLYLDEGGRVSLATEAEWEKAAKGPEGLIFPWGNQVSDDKANFASANVRPVGSFDCPDCYLGISDMSGNVWEWTRSPYQDYPFDSSNDRDNLAEDALWVMRGGSYNEDVNNVRSSVRGAADPGARRPFIGFRVVISKN